MIKLEVGKLYSVERCYWVMFPTKELAQKANRYVVAYNDEKHTKHHAAFWAKRLKCEVSFFGKDDSFVVVEKTRTYYKILTSTGKVGWMSYRRKNLWSSGCFAEARQNT